MYLSQVKTQHKAFLFADVDQMSISEIAKVIISRLGINRNSNSSAVDIASSCEDF